jgi:hypothetical protein
MPWNSLKYALNISGTLDYNGQVTDNRVTSKTCCVCINSRSRAGVSNLIEHHCILCSYLYPPILAVDRLDRFYLVVY